MTLPINMRYYYSTRRATQNIPYLLAYKTGIFPQFWAQLGGPCLIGEVYRDRK